ncbi:hypothetical protein [Moraxella catarrhalis]|jgi:hypothetical protein|uniref:hypothetical protein n=2 Tax=Moraxella catarrhalis TaxID=480 RepID=UPI0009C23F43|nr:hypothetical protein [Moraxella catarrhalis]ARE66974.1 hypothetical protein MC195_09355 [Moraxella catarrhalis]MPX27846.1 hypothetical protein [Moraxella catarrhalis]MPX68917.1 hypothetical protein [Moraxella catarrhalis]MPX85652.1 hypothetical protein [Moraxella catarrhalis]RKL79037.1 hypothetical protein D6D63_08355 [Moraxella catarrhalis]
MSNITPEYTRRAIKKYEEGLVRKPVTFSVEADSDILSAIDSDETPFTALALSLLYKHYGIEQPKE